MMLNQKIKILFIITTVLTLQYCTRIHKEYDPATLILHYDQEEDTSKLQAIRFLIKNINEQYSDVPLFINRDSYNVFNICPDTITSEASLIGLMERYNLYPTYEIINDANLVNNAFLIENTDLAFDAWNKYPWAKNIPEDIFRDYLLPYKIYGEKPGEWRKYFYNLYTDSLNTLMEQKDIVFDPDWFYNSVIVDKAGRWYVYKPSAIRLTRYSGIDELKIMRGGECENGAYLSAYIMRTFGLPATVDIIPLWGSRNGGHATEVFWDERTGCFSTPPGRYLHPRFPTKVFRYTFRSQNLWTDSVKSNVDSTLFLLEYLKHDHWLDVTHEHTKTADIEYTFPKETQTSYAYICVYNYGEWKPVYWSKTGDDRKAVFRNMGSNVLYRFALPENARYKPVDNIFRLDTLLQISNNLPDIRTTRKLNLCKLNSGSESWVKSGKSYHLYFWNNQYDWELFGTEICKEDSIVTFSNVPYNTYYRLTDAEGNEKLERIFTYEYENQVWW